MTTSMLMFGQHAASVGIISIQHPIFINFQSLLVGCLEDFFIFPYIENNTPN